MELPWDEALDIAAEELDRVRKAHGNAFLAIGINLQRGRQHIDCGCGGDSVPLSPGLVWRNLTMVLLLGCLLYPSLAAPTATIQLLGCAFALGLCALYVCYNQLQANAGIYRRLQKLG